MSDDLSTLDFLVCLFFLRCISVSLLSIKDAGNVCVFVVTGRLKCFSSAPAEMIGSLEFLFCLFVLTEEQGIMMESNDFLLLYCAVR